jgi:ABC-type sugar transport system permease subunit
MKPKNRWLLYWAKVICHSAGKVAMSFKDSSTPGLASNSSPQSSLVEAITDGTEVSSNPLSNPVTLPSGAKLKARQPRLFLSRPRLGENPARLYLYVVPAVSLMLIFIYWPLLYSIGLSLFNWNLIGPEKEFVGLDKYFKLFTDGQFWKTVGNTLFYIVVLAPLQIILPLGMALMLLGLSRSRLQTFYRTILFAPSIISFATAAVVWLWIFNPIQGLANLVLKAVGFSRVYWLSDANIAIWSIILFSLWKSLGFNMLLFLAALQAIPNELQEAARLDGARRWTLFRSIQWPLIAPTAFFVLITTVIYVGDESFAAINVLTEGGPYGSSSSILYYLYEQGFKFYDVGSASAVAGLTFAFFSAITYAQTRFLERRVYYE